MYGHLDEATEIYIDEVRVGDANSSYEEVAPAAGTAESPIVGDDDAVSEIDPPTFEMVSK
jgi:hypothetical protein